MNKLAEACHPIWAANKTNPTFLAPYMEEARRCQFGQHNDLERTYDSLGGHLQPTPTSRTSLNPIFNSRQAVGRHPAGGGPGAADKARYGDRDRADGAGGRQEAHSAGVSFGTLQLS